MINLFYTCIVSFLTFLPFAAKANNFEFVDRSENVILNDSLQSKSSVNSNNYIYVGLNEFVTYENFLTFSRNIRQYDYFPMTEVTVANFLLGQPARIYLDNLDVSVGDFYEGSFRVWGTTTARLDYIEFSYDGSLDYHKNFTVLYHSYQSIKGVGYYSFLDVNDSTCISNTVSYVNNTVANYEYDNCAIKFNASQFATLLQSFSYSLNNYDLGYNDGQSYGYQMGYADGYTEANNTDDVANSIFTGIFEIGLLPVNVFLTIFNFEVFGINIAGIVSGLLTMAVVVILIRFLLGGKNND